MSLFRVSFTMENWYEVEIEAENAEEALDKFHALDYDTATENLVGTELQDSVEVEEI